MYLLALFAAVDRPSSRRLAWLAAAVAALVLSNFYGALIGALVTPAAMAAYWCLMPPERRTWWGLAAPSLLLAGLCLSTYTVLRITHPSFLAEAWQLRNPLGDLVRYSASWEAYVLPPVDHPVVGPFSRRIWDAMGVDAGLVEQQLSLGSGCSAWRSWGCGDRYTIETAAPDAPCSCCRVGAWAYALSLMPGVDLDGRFGSALRASLQEFLPMFRAYARLGIVVALAVAIAAGVAVDGLLTRAQSGSVTTRRVALADDDLSARDDRPGVRSHTLASAGRTADPGPPLVDGAGRDGARARLHAILASPSSRCHGSSDRHAIEFLRPPFEDCGDPLLVDSMMAEGFTHLIVRTGHDRDTSGVDATHRFMLVRSYPDSRVYRVPSGVPVVTRNVEGFYPWEREPEFRRWMGQEGQWRVRNLTGGPLHATLRVQLNAFEHTRTLDVRLADVSIQVNVVPDRRAYSIGPFVLPAGDSELAFRGLEPATRPRDVARQHRFPATHRHVRRLELDDVTGEMTMAAWSR